MTLLISIEYRTRWGEQLVLRLGKRRIALQYADGGHLFQPDVQQEYNQASLWHYGRYNRC